MPRQCLLLRCGASCPLAKFEDHSDYLMIFDHPGNTRPRLRAAALSGHGAVRHAPGKVTERPPPPRGPLAAVAKSLPLRALSRELWRLAAARESALWKEEPGEDPSARCTPAKALVLVAGRGSGALRPFRV